MGDRLAAIIAAGCFGTKAMSRNDRADPETDGPAALARMQDETLAKKRKTDKAVAKARKAAAIYERTAMSLMKRTATGDEGPHGRVHPMRCVALLLLLAGCSHPMLTPVEVSVPVGIPCRVEEPQEPAWPTLVLAADAGLFEKAKAALAELELRRGYEGELLAAIRACR